MGKDNPLSTIRHQVVALLAPGELFGGVERHLLGLACGLERRGWKAPLMLFNDAELAAQARELGLDVIVLPRRFPLNPRVAGDLVEALDDSAAGYLHVHGYRAMVVADLASRMVGLDLPVIKTEHGLAEPAGLRFVEALKSLVYRGLDDFATRSTARVVCYVSGDLMDVKSSAHRGVIRQVVSNGIDALEAGDYDRPGDLPSDRVLVGMIGRLTDVKGVRYAIDALVMTGTPDIVSLVILGDGPLRDDLARHASQLGVADRVLFLGFKRNAYNYLAHFDALLMPSLHEGLPYTLLEAMSLKKPILASAVGGLAEVLENGRTGWLFPPRDPSAIAYAIQRLVVEKDAAVQLGFNAAAVQRERYSLDGMVDHYIEKYIEAAKSEVMKTG